jgi:hypothetical protein
MLMAKSNKTTPAVRTPPGRRRAVAEQAGASKVNDRVQEGPTKMAVTRPPASGIGKWTPPRDEVARRAYELFLQRGGSSGRDVEDWLEAERQVRAAYGR